MSNFMRFERNCQPANPSRHTEAPDVRAEVVARGKALIANPNYPSTEQVKSIAKLLAGELQHERLEVFGVPYDSRIRAGGGVSVPSV
jgi:hypothetical protein